MKFTHFQGTLTWTGVHTRTMKIRKYVFIKKLPASGPLAGTAGRIGFPKTNI